MKVELVYDNIRGKLNIPNDILCNGQKKNHHLLGLTGDNLTEIAGRVCYDSLKSEKTRNSYEYHNHINETGHSSVQGHYNFVVEIKSTHIYSSTEDFAKMAACLLNRPGVFTTYQYGDNYIRISLNLRAAIQWDKFGNSQCPTNKIVKSIVQSAAKLLAPLVFSKVEIQPEWNGFVWELVPPKFAHEKWYSFYIGDVSRGLTHELVRHGFQTAISQRSTRYVDESNSSWALHPFMTDGILSILDIWLKEQTLPFFDEYINLSCDIYDKCIELIQIDLAAKGVDKFTARKQARGAARGILGNALSTELIWSCSEQALNEVINQRASSHADAEIRLLANRLFEIVDQEGIAHPSFGLRKKISCPDGIGYELERLL